MEKPWRILEFYSGIGGMRYSLMRAGINAEVVEAFDINDTANDVYEHNFGHRPFQAKRTPLSFQDPFFNNWLQRTPVPLLAPEDTLSRNDHHFHDDRRDESCTPCEPIRNFLEIETLYNHQLAHADIDALPESNFLTVDCVDRITATATSSCDVKVKHMQNICTGQNGEELVGSGIDMSVLDNYIVPLSLIERWGSAMDIVYPDSKRCCCFTKSYYRYVKGTGSLLATSVIFKHGSTQKPEVHSLKDLGLRYFTPQEVANLHSFPEDFNFPQHISIRQQYALLGNSLSIAVVAPLFRYLFTDPT